MIQRPHPGTLLLVDDEKDILDILKITLAPKGYRVLTAMDGQEALAIVSGGEVDAIISDIQMPFMTGLQLLAEIRGLGIQTPFVIMTAYGDQEYLLEAIRLCATDFISKPYAEKEVLDVVDRVLKLGLAQRELENEMETILSNSGVTRELAGRIREQRKEITLLRQMGSRLKRA